MSRRSTDSSWIGSLAASTQPGWTEQQQTALQEALRIKPAAHFWNLVAKRVPGRSAEDCFKKFYSERPATRASQRLPPVEIESPISKTTDTKSPRSLRSHTGRTAETPTKELGATRKAAAGTVKEFAKQGKVTGNGRNAAALTRETRATSQGKKRRIEGTDASLDGRQTKCVKLESVRKLDRVKLGQKAGGTGSQFLLREEIESPLSQLSDTKNGRSVRWRSHTSKTTETPNKEQGSATRQAARGTLRAVTKQGKVTGNGRNAAPLTRETRARSRGKKRRIEEISASPNRKRTKRVKWESVWKLSQVTPEQKTKIGTESDSGKCSLFEKRQTRGGTRSEAALASEFDPSSGSDFNKQIESASPLAISVEDELWTKFQESALQDAYSTIKPTADFWRLISKRVPGKNAEECFNRFYSGHPTPPPAAQRSCSKEIDSSLSLSDPPKAKTARGKQRLIEAHRTVRHILRKQQVDDEGYEADAFAALEHPDVVQSVMESAKDEDPPVLAELQCSAGVSLSLPGTRERHGFENSLSDKENWMPKAVGNSRKYGDALSQLRNQDILTKVKNPAMLDKYIDHLHQRHTRRSRTKCSQKNANKTSKVYQHSRDALKLGDATLDVIHRAKQELRNVFLKSGSAVGNDFALDESNSMDEEDDEESVDSQLAF